ncbi:signal peptide peptidase SppA [Thermoleptolyngbya sichuanensis A183]|uniref:Protease 4 n=1 Tax=Thermoleptolyngbya sichuanensis A183 TaxID=2737172 RepID=A0A6M8BJT7_9CYAN|nr:signal peptide peptidase SppA [Thermoleptolyngbya sichuanensis]QKD83323.1 signal peptide peptidase SppA [Thermoleptolyngbya sichuanensis A183]
MRDFLKNVLATLTGLALFGVLSAGGMVMLLVAIALSGRDSGPRVEDKSVLTLNLDRGIADAPVSVNPGQVFQEALSGRTTRQPVSLRTAIDAIEAAAADKKIVGLLLEGNLPATTGYATLREVRQALDTFRDSGKPIYAYDVNWSERDYYLASAATDLAMNPAGVLEMNGLRSEMTFFAGALERFGVGVQVLQVGRYKSAVEPFTRQNNSPEARQQTEALLRDLWTEVITTASQHRDLSPTQIQAIADSGGLLMATEAKTTGLIDRVAYPDEVLADLKKLTDRKEDDKTFRSVGLGTYAQAVAAEKKRGDRIALVYLNGDIVGGTGSTGQIGSDRFVKLLRDLRLDKEIKAVVLRINSPGGSAVASDLIAREVTLMRKEKPVIASMGNVAASGGYYIAAQGSKVFASPNTVTGSIGVFGLVPNFQTLANRNGVTWDIIKTGRYADIETTSRPRTEAEMALLQRMAEQAYGTFLDTVASARPLSREQVNQVGQGRVWSGVAAKEVGLVDELGGLQAALKEAAAEAKLETWSVEEYPKRLSFGEQFLSDLQSRLPEDSRSRTLLGDRLDALQSDLEIFELLDDPANLYMRLLFNLRIE